MKIEPKLQYVDRLAFRLDADRAGVPADQVRPLHRQWIEASKVVRVVVPDLWFETVLEGAWVVAYRIVAQPEGLAVGEIRVFPLKGRTRPGEWRGALLGTHAEAPAGGITTRLLRQVRLDQSVWYGRGVLRMLASRHGLIETAAHPGRGRMYVPHVLVRAGIPTDRIPERRRRAGRKRLPHREYERTAREYTRLLLMKGRRQRLYEALAERLGVSVAQAQNRVARARKYGFLQSTPLRPRARRSPMRD